MVEQSVGDANRIKKTTIVEADQKIAWRVFTEKMGSWWPLAYYKIGSANAVDAVIDSGPHWAHSGPCLHDVDGDGRRDLLVGDFSGLFRLYRNVGTDREPKFAAGEVLKAGGVEAKVPIY